MGLHPGSCSNASVVSVESVIWISDQAMRMRLNVRKGRNVPTL